MAAAVAANKTIQAAAASDSNDNNAIMPPSKSKLLVLDPQLLMAARRGDSKRIKELLRLNIEEVELESHGNGGIVEKSASSSEAVILEVDPDERRPPAAPATPPQPLDNDGGLTSEGDTLLHVVAECGDSEQFIRSAKMIVLNIIKNKGGVAAARLALEARNSKGDTPLHRAAGAGNANMIACLIDLFPSTANGGNNAGAATAARAFLRTQNECGETALHHAVRAADNKVACIDQLMDVDPELACIPQEDGASPLYMAISLGEIEIARHLYVKSEGKLSYSGPDGRNVLHAAVHRGQALPMILGWLKDTKPKEDSSSVSLVSQLTSQRDKQQKGSTPLHLAASLWGCRTARLLLDANESTAYQADDRGSYPIHVAAWHDVSLVVVKMLLERCPDCATLRDGRGRTFLHVATEEECHAVVRYVCREMPQRESSMIVNAQDSNGDTALHCAVRAGNLAVFNCLLRNRQVRLDVANKDGMTPRALSWTLIPGGFDYELNPRNIVHRSLCAAGAQFFVPGRLDLFAETHKRVSKRGPVEEESKKYTEAAQVMSIVTALIATVTFASAFTLPGGYRSAGDAAAAAGTPVLAGSYAFDAFILADTLAFICSILSTCTLIYAGVPAMDIRIRNWYFNVSGFLLVGSARSLVAAFGLGLYLVLAPAHDTTTTAVAVCVIVSASSLYGNMEAWKIIRMATTVLARIGIRRYALVRYAKGIFYVILVHFWLYVIIFGLPAIRKWVHQKQL